MNDIDIQQQDAINTSNSMREARNKHNVCFHNHIQGALCLSCKKQFKSFEELNDERRELIAEYC